MEKPQLTSQQLTRMLLEKVPLQKLIEDWNLKLEAETPCPFCSDTQNTFSVAPDSSWKCTSCDETGSDYVSLYTKINNLKVDVAIQELYNKHIRRLVGKVIINKLHNNLTQNPELVHIICKKLGCGIEVIKNYKLGFEPSKQILSVPVKDIYGNYVNLLKCEIFEVKDELQPLKFKPWEEQYGENVLFFTTGALENDLIYLVGSIRDVLLAAHQGLAAVATTNGPLSWDKNFNRLFTGKDVVVLYPTNTPHVFFSATSRKRELFSVTNKIKSISIPIAASENGLFQYLHKSSLSEFADLVEATPWWEAADIKKFVGASGAIKSVTLQESTNEENFFKRITFKGVVCGKVDAPYFVPNKIRVTCSGSGKKMCQRCPVYISGRQISGNRREFSFNIDVEHKMFPLLVSLGYKGKGKILREIASIPSGCNISIEEITTTSVEVVTVTTDVLYHTFNEKHVTRLIYSVGSVLDVNRAYIFEGYAAADNQRSQAIVVALKTNPIADSLDDFSLDGANKQGMNKFQPKSQDDIEAIAATLAGLYSNYAESVTWIYGKPDLHLAIDLPFFSPVAFNFNGQFIHKGWLDVLVIGDSQIGKTRVAEGFIKHYQLGDVATGETCSYVGLVGGVTKLQGTLDSIVGKNSPE